MHLWNGWLSCSLQLDVNVGGLIDRFPMVCCKVPAFKKLFTDVKSEQTKLDALVSKSIDTTVARLRAAGRQLCPADKVDKSCAIGEKGEVLAVGQDLARATEGLPLRSAAARVDFKFLKTLNKCILDFARNIALFRIHLSDA